MINRNTVKNILLYLILMGIVSFASLLLLGVLTYTLTWKAPQAMIGITLTYILSGLAGGILSGVLDRKGSGVAGLEAKSEFCGRAAYGFLLGTAYMVILIAASTMFTENGRWDFIRLIMLWVLLSCSSVLGSFMSSIFCKKR